VQLTGWKIDIKSESKMRELARWLGEAMSVAPGCGEPEGELLMQQGITSLEDLSRADLELLTSLPGVDEASARAIQKRAGELAVEKRRSDEANARAAAEAGPGEGARESRGPRN